MTRGPRLGTLGLALVRSCALALGATLIGCAQTAGPLPSEGVAPAGIAPEGAAYYWQSVSGHLALMRGARPVDDWLADPSTPTALADKLRTVQRMRRFAVTQLHLPDNASYTRYAHLTRRAVVWNMVAAPELSLTLQTWCFPVLGCVGYRGYFDEKNADTFARQLRQQGLEATVYPVPAYSTLGWMNWLGGDPLLSTFLGYPEGEVARLLFHELTHQLVYVAGDTRFNESLATAVERLGGERWLAQASPEAQQAYAQFDQRRQAFRELTRETRKNLDQIYALSLDLNGIDATEKRSELLQKKQQTMTVFKLDYERLKAQWGGHSGYDAWVARANNASFAVQAAYDDAVPAFTALFEREGRNFPRFYDAVRRLAELPKTQRDAELNRLKAPTGGRLG